MKTFLLGCGAQKSGTTWLAKNMNGSPEYWDGGIKEWRFWKHYFDNEHCERQLHKMKNMLRDITSPGGNLKKQKLKWRISALQDPKLFLQDIVDEFFKMENVKILADMTPSNGTLSADELSFISDYFNDRGIKVKPLFIMRDPFERIWSEVKMNVQNKYPEDYSGNKHFMCEKLLEMYRINTVEQKTRYEDIVKNLESVFRRENICYEFSERIFSQDGLNKVTNHLNISNLIVDKKSPNSTPKLIVIPPQVKCEIINYYKDTYLSIFDRFGCDVKECWKESYEFLL